MRLLQVRDNGGKPLLVGIITVGKFSGVLTVVHSSLHASLEIYMLSTTRKVTGKLKGAKECKLCKDFETEDEAIQFAGSLQNRYKRLSQLTAIGFYRF